MNILDNVGNTPLFELNKIYMPKRGIRLFVKAEFMNPSGSVKDRAAKAMILDGIQSGKLTRKKAILDATSGSTGIAYAMMGALLGYRVVLCVPANLSQERRMLIKAYGAEMIETDPLEGSDGACDRAKKLAEEYPEQYFYPDQYHNENNWKAHYTTTAEELWQQTEGKITHFVAGAGTSGTFMGTTKRLKELNKNIQGILMQPDSPFHGLEGIRHLASTENQGFFDKTFPDEVVEVSTENAYKMVRKLAAEEGLLVGISAAANVLAACKVAESAEDNSVIVTVLGDGGYRYLSEPVWREQQ